MSSEIQRRLSALYSRNAGANLGGAMRRRRSRSRSRRRSGGVLVGGAKKRILKALSKLKLESCKADYKKKYPRSKSKRPYSCYPRKSSKRRSLKSKSKKGSARSICRSSYRKKYPYRVGVKRPSRSTYRKFLKECYVKNPSKKRSKKGSKKGPKKGVQPVALKHYTEFYRQYKLDYPLASRATITAAYRKLAGSGYY
jgi:hypothetical protein